MAKKIKNTRKCKIRVFDFNTLVKWFKLFTKNAVLQQAKNNAFSYKFTALIINNNI